MKFNTLKEFEEMRDLIAEKRDTAKQVLDLIYDEEMSPVLQALYEFQQCCKHLNKVVKDNGRGSHSENCPDCDWFMCYGPVPSCGPNRHSELRKEMKDFLKRKNLL